jgi:hypothetical protein
VYVKLQYTHYNLILRDVKDVPLRLPKLLDVKMLVGKMKLKKTLTEALRMPRSAGTCDSFVLRDRLDAKRANAKCGTARAGETKNLGQN